MYLYRPYPGPADTTLEGYLMDNVLLFSYFVFMILMPALPLLAGGDHGYFLPLGHGHFMPLPLFYNTALALVFSATIVWRRLRWVPVAGEMVGESYDLAGLRIAIHAWRYEFRGLVYETEDVDLVDILNTRRHGTVWVDPDRPSRILPPSWRGRLLIYLLFGAIPVYVLLESL